MPASSTPPPGSPDPDSIAERLKQQFGDQLGRTPPLDPEPTPEKDTPSTLFDKLRGAGTRGARYRLLGEVARGGMGVILKIWDDELRRTLAMKIVLGRGDESKGDTPHIDPKTLGRFLEEAQVTGQLDHPGIVPVHELGLGADGRVYFTMRLVKGEDLRSIFERVRTGEDGWNQVRALGVLLKVCEAMSYAHSKKVVHRDLKPANVMVGKFGEVYVMDWGLARVLGREDKHDLRIQSQPTTQSVVKTERREKREETPDSPLVTMDGDVVGTPSYMPPEQAKGQLDKLGPHSDVYALGAMLYQLLTGGMPYVPRDTLISQRTVLARLIDGPPEPIESLAPKTPSELVAICEKAMAREFSARYADTRAFSSDLRAYLEGHVVRAYETGTWAESRKWVQRNKPLAASLAAAALILIGGVVTSTEFGNRASVRAAEAVAARNDLVLKNTELQSTNSALDKARSEAAANATVAQTARLEAEQKANDVLSLSAQKDLDDLVARANKLWPAYPDMIPEYEKWLAEARELIDGRPADPAKGQKHRPSLAEHKAKLAELRSKAKPLNEVQAKSEHESHPSYPELLAKQAELTWRSRMLGLESWPSEPAVEAELAQENLPGDANGLNTLAWHFLDPYKPVFGSEVKTLLLARRALAAATQDERGAVRDSLAWALFRVGRLDEALAEERIAVGEAREDTLKESSANLGTSIASWRGEELPNRRHRRDTLAEEVSRLERTVCERRTFEYDNPESAWWDRQLSRLIESLTTLSDPQVGLMSDTLSESFGWGIEKRFKFARAIREISFDGPSAKQRWGSAGSAIAASAKYGGLILKPQIGLLPIGEDAKSGLWEFWNVQTGVEPVRDDTGKLVLTEDTGLIFVLIPGGRFWMGSQRTDPTGHDYEIAPEASESPVHEVDLSPYFLSKFEMTQGQWMRVTGSNPSYYGPTNSFAGHQHNLMHPVESVTWTECVSLLQKLMLLLPSEAQWERGCRGGTETPWWTGAERDSLRGKVNIADRTVGLTGAKWPEIENWPDLVDGWVVHAAVGSFPANAFGLCETSGNVWEWCLDGYDPDFFKKSPKLDPVSPPAEAAERLIRGGGFHSIAGDIRSAHRYSEPPAIRHDFLGLRPARIITR